MYKSLENSKENLYSGADQEPDEILEDKWKDSQGTSSLESPEILQKNVPVAGIISIEKK